MSEGRGVGEAASPGAPNDGIHISGARAEEQRPDATPCFPDETRTPPGALKKEGLLESVIRFGRECRVSSDESRKCTAQVSRERPAN